MGLILRGLATIFLVTLGIVIVINVQNILAFLVLVGIIVFIIFRLWDDDYRI